MLEVVSSREAIVLAETFAVQTQVETLVGFIELFADVVLRLVDLQLGSVEDVHRLDVSSVDLLGHVVAVLMESLQLSRAGHFLDFVTRCEQKLSLHQGQVEVDLSVSLNVVCLDSVAKEVSDSVLNGLLVAQVHMSNCMAFWHPDGPLDLVCAVNLESSTYLG